MKFQAPKGVSEYFPPRSGAFEKVRDGLIASAKSAGYHLLELPIFEDTELFTRGVGESTDVVSKEMYTFEDRGGRSLTLRPEGTAGVIRAVIEHGLDRGQLPLKVFYTGPYFRAERPQAGRYRQFYQVGIEAIGAMDPALDAEVISIAHEGFRALGLRKFRLEITSLGDTESRADHRVDLVKFISGMKLDEATATRAKVNPLRLFDDKRAEITAAMSKAPLLFDYLSAESKDYFLRVQRYLSLMDIEFIINPRMVRGLDYYTGTTFEFIHELLGAQSGIGGGGRYDGLMSSLGGQDVSGIGFGLGVDRVLLACEAEGIDHSSSGASDLYLIPVGDEAKDLAVQIALHLRKNDISVEVAYGDRGVKAAMKGADKNGAIFSLVLGDSEMKSGTVELKRMSTGESISVTLADLRSDDGISTELQRIFAKNCNTDC